MDSLFTLLDPAVAPWAAGSVLTLASAILGALVVVVYKTMTVVRWAVRLLLDLLQRQTEIQEVFAQQIAAVERRQAVIEQQVERVVVSLEGHIREHRLVGDYERADRAERGYDGRRAE